MFVNIILFLVVALVAYLMGCINSSIIVTRFFKVENDIRKVGSGNAGFTNVLRTMGKKMAVFTFIGDFLKGVLAVWFAVFLFSFSNSDAQTIKCAAYVASLFCILGHIYPCFFSFKGGKGILTAWATSLLVDWRVFLIIISVFLIVLIFSKIVSLSSIMAAISYPVATFATLILENTSPDAKFKNMIFPTLVSITMTVIVIYKHRGNIQRLLNKTEKRITIGK